jgi:hypothetical protein
MQNQFFINPPMMQETVAIPPPKPVRIEEILRLITFLFLALFLCCHLLFIPIEVLVMALCHSDVALRPEFNFLLVIYISKYVIVIIIQYCAYHHTNLWMDHHHVTLYIFSILCLIVSAFFVWMVIEAELAFKRMGFGPIYDHPIYYDFMGFCIVGIFGTIYIFFLACTKPQMYSMVPQYDPSQEFMMVPPTAFQGHARREGQTVLELDNNTRMELMRQGIVPMYGSHAIREMESNLVQPKAPEQPQEPIKAEAKPVEKAPVQPQFPTLDPPESFQAPQKPRMMQVPIYYVPQY